MAVDDAFGAVARASEAWLDVVLMATACALAPYEWSGQLLIAWAQAVRGNTATNAPADSASIR